MNVAVIGSGHVGLVAAACLAEIGHTVICIDRDEQRIARLHCGQIPIHERFLPELVQRHAGDRLHFTTSLSDAVRQAEAVFMAVGTPAADSGEADLSAVEAVARDLASCLSGYKVIVEKSTVPVSTCERVRQVLLWNGATAGGFDVVSNPEFLREGTAVTDFLYPDRIVVGADSPRAAQLMREIYQPLTSGAYAQSTGPVPAPNGAKPSTPFIVTSAKSAELIKHASNSFLAMKISFINAVAEMCERVGANIEEVCAGIGSDSRISPEFLRPGIGYGGSCFPKDLLAFRSVAKEYGLDLSLLTEVIRINEQQRERFIQKLRRVLWNVRGKRIGVLGLAFKGGTDDLRESPAVAIVQRLADDGCELVAYDPAAMENARRILPESVRMVENAYAAAESADALLVLTDWDEFAELDLKRLRAAMRHPILVDGRNLFSPENMAGLGFRYVSVGRAEKQPEQVLSGFSAALLKAS
jgi:UDPglucose 6-dehydrogenase